MNYLPFPHIKRPDKMRVILHIQTSLDARATGFDIDMGVITSWRRPMNLTG